MRLRVNRNWGRDPPAGQLPDPFGTHFTCFTSKTYQRTNVQILTSLRRPLSSRVIFFFWYACGVPSAHELFTSIVVSAMARPKVCVRVCVCVCVCLCVCVCVCVCVRVYSVYLLYEYKRTNTDSQGAYNIRLSSTLG